MDEKKLKWPSRETMIISKGKQICFSANNVSNVSHSISSLDNFKEKVENKFSKSSHRS
uniref:Uncharacterized protein n=1 Tax=Rhizophora mucronata TaxID=61149 RepID=A0A2P2QMU7_RHIMU